MTNQKYFPLKIGLLIVAASYFLFTLHAMFTTQWIGEWNRIGGGSFYFFVYVTDISAFVGMIFRFLASIIAFASVVYYFSKGTPSTGKAFKILRWVLVFEGIYWLGLVATTVLSVPSLNQSVTLFLQSLAMNFVPLVLESIVLPISLLILAFKLNPNKPMKQPIRWGLITGAVYIFVFWLTNTSMWLFTIQAKGMVYLTANPENIVSFIITAFGLLFLAIYASIFAKQNSNLESLQELNLRSAGAIILSLGLFFLWNYLTWVWFNYPWTGLWDAWFLGHNLDLWMLSLPLLGLPMLFANKVQNQNTSR